MLFANGEMYVFPAYYLNIFRAYINVCWIFKIFIGVHWGLLNRKFLRGLYKALFEVHSSYILRAWIENLVVCSILRASHWWKLRSSTVLQLSNSFYENIYFHSLFFNSLISKRHLPVNHSPFPRSQLQQYYSNVIQPHTLQ